LSTFSSGSIWALIITAEQPPTINKKEVNKTNITHFQVKKRLHPVFFPRLPLGSPKRERGPTRSRRERGGMGLYPLFMLTLRKSSIVFTS
jgi:hypothetical protein